MCGWFLGERLVVLHLLRSRFRAPAPFLLFWLTGWTLGGAWCLFILAWTLAGRETVALRPDALVLRRSVLGLGRDREYDLADVKALRVSSVAAALAQAMSGMGSVQLSRSPQTYGVRGGPIAFDDGSRTIRLGAGLEEERKRL